MEDAAIVKPPWSKANNAGLAPHSGNMHGGCASNHTNVTAAIVLV